MKTNELPISTNFYQIGSSTKLVATHDEEVSAQAVIIFRSTKGSRLGYLCRTCAKALGGEWPAYHVATMSPGICDICQYEKSLASGTDWQLDEKGKRYSVSALEWD